MVSKIENPIQFSSSRVTVSFLFASIKNILQRVTNLNTLVICFLLMRNFAFILHHSKIIRELCAILLIIARPHYKVYLSGIYHKIYIYKDQINVNENQPQSSNVGLYCLILCIYKKAEEIMSYYFMRYSDRVLVLRFSVD